MQARQSGWPCRGEPAADRQNKSRKSRAQVCGEIDVDLVARIVHAGLDGAAADPDTPPGEFPEVGVSEHFRGHYGPTKRAFEALDAAGQQSLRDQLEAIVSAHNKARDGSAELEAEYLDVQVAQR